MNGLDFSVVWTALPYLWQGLLFSLSLTVVAFLIGMTFGTLLALAQHLELPAFSQIARGYVAVMRSIPLIMVLFWFFFLVPIIVGYLSGSGRPVPIGANATAFITFGLFEAAYYSEIIRTGLRTIPRGQYESARALSLGVIKTYRLVILPQVIRAVSPIMLSQTIILFQDTSLVYVLSLTDLLGAASKVAQINGRLVEMYLAAAAIYFVISSVASQAVATLKRKVAR
jgi:glutamate/aspartate transport system permease protein